MFHLELPDPVTQAKADMRKIPQLSQKVYGRFLGRFEGRSLKGRATKLGTFDLFFENLVGLKGIDE